jgi:hypothetical protein
LFQLLYAVLEILHFLIKRTQRGAVAPLPHLDGRRPIVKRRQQLGVNTFQLRANPPSIFLGETDQLDYRSTGDDPFSRAAATKA